MGKLLQSLQVEVGPCLYILLLPHELSKSRLYTYTSVVFHVPTVLLGVSGSFNNPPPRCQLLLECMVYYMTRVGETDKETPLEA